MSSVLKANNFRIAAALFLLALAGCSSQNRESPINPETGEHSVTWLTDHRSAFLADNNGCTPCHGQDMKGGMSGVSCFSASFNGVSCHATGPSGHPLGWTSPDQHGASAKAAPDALMTAGLSTCQICHGSGFSGGISTTTCLNTSGCHGPAVGAPHSPAPWKDGARTHTTTDPSNAPACALCHLNARTPPSYASVPAGTQAGCFNNTLCHGTPGHAAGWSDPAQHGVTAEQDFTACKTCHGTAYQGGVAAITCYQCHAGPGLDHPAANWVVSNHRTAAQGDIAACRTCHGADYLGGGSHIACTSCHMEDQTRVHRLAWYPDVRLNHRAYAAANGTASCATAYCHGTTLAGVINSGPSCSSCHTWPFTGGACGSCHGVPPAGSAFPDTAGRHPVHTGLANVTCDTCHTGAGTGTANHQDGAADVGIAGAYDASTGAASFNATAHTCSNVSCHGGQTTPSFLTGSISVNTCASCHASGTAQYNGYSSGKHAKHISAGAVCVDCHDPARLAPVHFDDLDTRTMLQSGQTISSGLHYNGSSCTFTCHLRSERHDSGMNW